MKKLKPIMTKALGAPYAKKEKRNDIYRGFTNNKKVFTK